MPVSFTLGSPRALDLVSFGWSPLFEALLSLRAVAHPKRTPMHLPWVRRCRSLPDDLRAEIDELVGPFDVGVPGIFEVGLLGSSPRFDDELAALAAVDDERVTYEVGIACGGLDCGYYDGADTSVVHDADFRREVFDLRPDQEGRRALATAAFEDPAALRDRYVAMMRRYWDEAFCEEWDRIVPRIEAEVTSGAHALVTRGAPGLVDELFPEARWDVDAGAIVVARDWDETVDVRDRGGLLLVPTVYGWPRVLLELTSPWPTAIIFPLRDLRAPAVPHATDAEVVDGLRALADETRLQIARLVADVERSTKELAELLSLSDSAISRHLKILEAAGLVASRRDGYFVLYGLRPERLDVLGTSLRSTLGLTVAGAGPLPALPVDRRMPAPD